MAGQRARIRCPPADAGRDRRAAGGVAVTDQVDRQTASHVTSYCSTMCSTVSERLARIGQAIDELAAETRGTGRPMGDAGSMGIVPAGTGLAVGGLVGSLDDRLARIWLMMAELDPELARRVTDYGGSPAR